MGIENLHFLGPVKVGNTTIGGVTSCDIQPGIGIQGEATSGDIGVRHQSIYSIKPKASFATHDLAVALGVCGSLGCNLATSPLYAWAKRRTVAGAIDTEGHKMYTVRGGLLYPESLSCPHGGDAQISYGSLVMFDGTNVPIVVSETAPPTGVADNRWALKSASIAGIGTNSVKSANVDFGINVSSEGSNSDIYDSHAVIESVRPKVTLSGVALDWFESIGLTGKSATAATLVFRKRLNQSTFVTPEVLVTLTFSGLVYVTQAFRAGQRGPAECTVACDVTYDGTNSPIAVSTS